MREKEFLREQMLDDRKTLDIVRKREYDHKICELLKDLVESEEDINVIHSYLPIKGEIDITPFLDWVLKKKKKYA